MEKDQEDEEYETASPEQKLSIATYFIMSSPVGEVDFVVADTKKLVDDREILNPNALKKILKDYNVEQQTSAPIPSSEKKKKCIVSSYGMVSDTEYLNPNSGEILIFDHVTREFTGKSEKKSQLTPHIEKKRAAIQEQVDDYIEDRYKEGKCVGVVYALDGGEITICLAASNTKISSYWTGAWNSTFTIDVEKEGKQNLVGNIKVHVHYFEDGNVQLHSAIENKVELNLSSVKGDNKNEAIAIKIVETIRKIEDSYQSNLETMYVEMHRSTFKEMRRFLPINKQPMEWSIAAHGVGMKS